MTIELSPASESSFTHESGTSADRLEPFFRSYSVAKLIILGSLSFNLHIIYWFWSQWRAEGPNESRGWTVLKMAFSLIFVYTMARDVRDEALRRGVRCRYAPAALTVGIWVTAVAIRALPAGYWDLFLLWLTPSLLALVQSTVNGLHRQASGRAPEGWRWWEIGLAALLGLFWLLALIGSMLPPTTTLD